MKIITTAEALTAALKLGFKPDSGRTIPILAYVKVSPKGVVATNLDNFTLVPLAGKGKGDVLLPYKQTLDVLNKEKGPLVIEWGTEKKAKKGAPEPQEQVALTVNGSTFKFDIMKPVNFPKFPEPAKTAITIDGKEFKTLLTRCLFAISHEESRYTLNGALLATSAGLLRLIATDGHRLSVTELSMKVEEGIKLLIPCGTLEYLKTRIGETIEIGYDDNTLTIRTNDIALISRRLMGQFPNWEAVMPTALPITATVTETEKIIPTLTRVAKCADSRSGCVKWTFGNRATVIKAVSSEYGEAQATIPIAINSKTQVAIGINSEYVIDFLKAIGNVPFEIGMKDPQSSVLFSVDNFKHIVMPMRI